MPSLVGPSSSARTSGQRSVSLLEKQTSLSLSEGEEIEVVEKARIGMRQYSIMGNSGREVQPTLTLPSAPRNKEMTVLGSK